MYAAVPRITPCIVIAGEVIVGEFADRLAADAIARPIDPSPSPDRSRAPSLAIGPQLDVGGLQIAMDDALLVRGFERLRDLPRNRQRFVERIGPCAMRSASVGPSTSSITSALTPPLSSTP